MQTEYWRLMEKYSSYRRSELETQESLREQWQKLKCELRAAGDIENIGYHLNLFDEKEIGKAKVVNGVITYREAFSYLLDLKPNRQNAFLMKSVVEYKTRL